MATSQPFAEIGAFFTAPESSRFWPIRRSSAKFTPFASRPGTLRSRGASEPSASTTASKSRITSSAGISFFAKECTPSSNLSVPTAVPSSKVTPSAFICSRRRSISGFSSLKSGMPSAIRPPARSFFSKTVTRCPSRASCCAQARPEGPEPITATFLPVRMSGTSGFTQPDFQARSMIERSIV